MLSHARITPLRAVLTLVPLGLAVALAISIATGDVRSAVVAALVCASPLAIYVTLRWPLVFPFGLYAATIPLDSILSIGSGVTATRAVGIVAAGALVLRILILRRALAPPAAWTAWGAVMLWILATMIWSVDQTDSLRIATIMLSLFVVYTIASVYPVERGELLAFFAILVAVGVGLALYAFQQYVTGSQALDKRLQIGNAEYYIDPNHFAANFLLPLAVATLAILVFRNLWARVLLGAATGVMGLGLVLTGSRGGLISFAVMLLYVGVRTRRLVATAVIAVVGLLASVAYPKVWERFTDPSQGAASGRFYIWEVARPALLRQMRWIYGNGIYSFPTVYNESLRDVYQATFQGYDRVGHNLFVQSSVELGVIGLALVLYAWYRTWNATDAVPRGSPWYAARVASEAVTIGLFVTAMSVDLLWFKYFWLGITLATLVRNAYAPRRLGTRRRVTPLLPIVARQPAAVVVRE